MDGKRPFASHTRCDHEPCFGAQAFWSAAALCRFCASGNSESARGLAQSKTWRQFARFVESLSCDRLLGAFAVAPLSGREFLDCDDVQWIDTGHCFVLTDHKDLPRRYGHEIRMSCGNAGAIAQPKDKRSGVRVQAVADESAIHERRWLIYEANS